MLLSAPVASSQQQENSSRISFSRPTFKDVLGNSTCERALATRRDEQDTEFEQAVYWTVEALFYASQENITAINAEKMPEVHLFDPAYLIQMFQHAVATAGSYSEIYNRHFATTAVSASNATNTVLGGIL